MKEKIVTMSIVVEDPIEAADSFSRARKVERAVREMKSSGPFVYKNFTGNFTTLPDPQKKSKGKRAR